VKSTECFLSKYSFLSVHIPL